jgi:hypothetical protein
VVRLNQAVHDFGKIFPWDTEFPRAAALADGQDDVVRAVLVLGRRNGENAVFSFLDVLDFLTLDKLKIGARRSGSESHHCRLSDAFLARRWGSCGPQLVPLRGMAAGIPLRLAKYQSRRGSRSPVYETRIAWSPP